MENIQTAEDIIPIAEFKSHASSFLNKIKENHRSIIITQHGKPAGVVLSPGDYDELMNREKFIRAILRGFKDSEEGRVISNDEMEKQLKAEFGV